MDVWGRVRCQGDVQMCASPKVGVLPVCVCESDESQLALSAVGEVIDLCITTAS